MITGLSNLYVQTLGASGLDLFAGTLGGVFHSSNHGTSWSEIDTGLTITDVASLASSGTYFFAGTYGGGVWRRPLSEVLAVQETSVGVPATFSLEQNYPNPFNLGTTIFFSLPTAEYVTLQVFDILGREVSSLISSEHAAGRYRMAWQANDVASGVYYYRLRAGSYVAVKKMMLGK